MLPREHRSRFPTITAAKQGFYVSVNLQNLSCYRCGFAIRIDELVTVSESETLIRSHSLTQCLQILGLGLTEASSGADRETHQRQDGPATPPINGPCNLQDSPVTNVNENPPSRDDTASGSLEHNDSEIGGSSNITNDRCDISLVDHAVTLGIDMFLIERALSKAPPRAEFKTVPSLVKYVFEFEEKIDPLGPGETPRTDQPQERRKKRTLTKREKENRRRRLAARGKVDEKKNVKPQTAEAEVLTPDIKALKEEIEDLEDEGLCKICVDEPSVVVTIPCGHFMMCRVCAAQQINCPLCRQTIQRTITVNTDTDW